MVVIFMAAVALDERMAWAHDVRWERERERSVEDDEVSSKCVPRKRASEHGCGGTCVGSQLRSYKVMWRSGSGAWGN